MLKGLFKFFNILTLWDDALEAAPAGTVSPTGGDDAIRETRIEVGGRVNQEHVFRNTDTTGACIHRKGSAVDYYQESAPTLRPDGVTALNASDYGRKWTQVSTQRTFVYTATGWLKTDPTIELLASDPASPLTGQLWYRTDI